MLDNDPAPAEDYARASRASRASLERRSRLSASGSKRSSRRRSSILDAVPSRGAGLSLAFLALAAAAPDGTFLRSLQATGAPDIVILAWKQILVGAMQICFAAYNNGPCSMLEEAAAAWPWMIVGSVCSLFSYLNTAAVLTTSAAAALALAYMAPLWAAPMGVMMNADPLHYRTICAICVAVFGVALIFAPNFTAGDSGGSLLGDIFGLMAGMGLAAQLVCSRHTTTHRPRAPVTLGSGVGGLAFGTGVATIALCKGESLFDFPPYFLSLVLAMAGSGTAYMVLSLLAARYLSGAELGLYLSLDCTCGPFIVWVVTGEVPPTAVIWGCGVLMLSVFMHEILAIRADGMGEPIGNIGDDDEA